MSESELAIAGFYDHEREHGASDWGGDDLFVAPGPRRRRFERTQYVAADPSPRAPEPRPEPARAAVIPRRTVTITGRPEGAARRPARTIDERIAHRPERIASWTCALGALSILLAIVTAQ